MCRRGLFLAGNFLTIDYAKKFPTMEVERIGAITEDCKEKLDLALMQCPGFLRIYFGVRTDLLMIGVV